LPDGVAADFLLPDKIKLATGTETPDLIGTVAKTRLDLLDNHLKTFASTQANKLTVSGVANYDVDRDEKPDPSSGSPLWRFAGPPDRKGKTADARTVFEILGKIATELNEVKPPGRFVDETPTPEKLIEYGLAPPAKADPMTPPTPRLKVAIGLPGTDPKDKEITYEFGKETPDPNLVYARQTGRAAVFTVPRAIFDKLKDADLRDRAIFQFDPAQITGVEFKGWKDKTGFLVDLNVEKNKDGVLVMAKGPPDFTLDPAKVSAFLATLNKTPVKEFLPGVPKAEQGFGDDRSLIIVLKTSAGPLISLNLGAPANDGASYYGWTSILPQTAPVFTVEAATLKAYKDSPKAFSR
jgi:hypothetical protein